ncbi:GFA family protein [Pandoraea apista]|uniref:Aldehyde-activating protein n=1 Tax=Pandoraea apista TaxID=93218 RepID=A0A5E5P9T2_9BURK|nr:GFA family protein [Pandoraea apista]AJF00435.1 aldehyde-activating protein [Pandoraea apista]AKH74619.1 aldehyde-activating protein [Pandoraea apista]AKI63169.1 aldehyde-activating protein [Pandoraea apista]AVF41432.1 GFA family protein [Pandoraea apista]OXS92552.1 aldehyde-activating protein [Pandoraea apista]
MANQQYSGGCHCGDLRFTANIDLSKTIACNCSICKKRGLILAFSPIAEFSQTAGVGKAKEYLFNKHVIRHQFCPTCGVEAFAFGEMPDGAKMAAVNVRCIDDIDLATVHPAPFDGASK